MHSSMLQGLCIEDTHKPTAFDKILNQETITNTLIRDFFGDRIQNLEIENYSDSDFIQVFGSNPGVKDYELTIELAAMPEPEYELYQIALAYDLDVRKLQTLGNILKRDHPNSNSSYDDYINEAAKLSELNPIGLKRFEKSLRNQYSDKPDTPFSEIINNQWLTWRKVQIPLQYEFTKQIIRDNPNLYKTLIQIVQRKFLNQSPERDIATALANHNPISTHLIQDDSLSISDYPDDFQNAITTLTTTKEVPANPADGPFGKAIPASISETRTSYRPPFELIDWLDTNQRLQSRRTNKIAEYCRVTYGGYCVKSPDKSSCENSLESQCKSSLSYIAEARLQIILRGRTDAIQQCQNKHCNDNYRGLLPCEQRFLDIEEMYPVFAYQGRSIPSKLTFDKNSEKSGETKDSLIYFGNLQNPFINTPVDSPLIANYYRIKQGVRMRKFDLIMLANGQRDPQLTYVINEQLGLNQPEIKEQEPQQAEAPEEQDINSLDNIADNKLRDNLRKNALVDKEKLKEFQQDEAINKILTTYENRIDQLKKEAEEKKKKEAEPKEDTIQNNADKQQAPEIRTFFNFLDVDPFNLAINMQEDEFEFYKDHIMNHIPVRVAKNTNSYGQTECLEVLMDAANPNIKEKLKANSNCFEKLFKNSDLASKVDSKIHLTFFKLSLSPKKPFPFSAFN